MDGNSIFDDHNLTKAVKKKIMSKNNQPSNTDPGCLQFWLPHLQSLANY